MARLLLPTRGAAATSAAAPSANDPPEGVQMSRLVKIILAILLPPIAVFLERGISGSLLLNILLTLLAWLPGAIHALFVVTRAPAPQV